MLHFEVEPHKLLGAFMKIRNFTYAGLQSTQFLKPKLFSGRYKHMYFAKKAALVQSTVF